MSKKHPKTPPKWRKEHFDMLSWLYRGEVYWWRIIVHPAKYEMPDFTRDLDDFEVGAQPLIVKEESSVQVWTPAPGARKNNSPYSDRLYRETVRMMYTPMRTYGVDMLVPSPPK